MLKKALLHFKKNDPLLHSTAIKINFSRELKESSKDLYFLDLCEIIVGQQLSSKAADSIFNRFEKLFSKKITPDKVFKIPHEKLRSASLSNSKAKYLKNIASAVMEGALQLIKVDSMTDDEVKQQLIKIKGVGPWTAEMFLMFTLGRPDVFSHGDLGLKKGIKKIYRFKKDPSIKTIEKIIKKWSPYKTYASLILWQSLEVE